jgi:hypothetical protein
VLGLSTESREFAVEGGTIYMSGAPTLVAVKPPGPAEASRPEAFFSSAPEAPPAPTPPDVAHHLVFDPESSPAFKHEVRSALAYLARAPGTASLVSRLDRGPNTVTLQESAWLDDDFAAFDPDTGTIAFNPHLGLQSAGGVIPPALILAHELGHAEEFGAHELRACIEAQLEDPVFGTATERRNCLEVEFPIAAQLDLPLNVDRTALVIPVECSTCKK